MERFERTGLWIAAALSASACGGDYWLGGRGVHRASGGDSGPLDASTAAIDQSWTADVVLTGDQSFELGDGAAACRIVGNGHGIRSKGTWTGRVSIRGIRS